ncbi:PD40 domain-containing protein [Candidatus Pacearchaeota archaeon]|nr:PD40 domain-containing protein [Candidatus Pacearchaeota archaeon]
MKKTLKIGLLGLLTSFGVGFSGCDYKGIEEKIEAPQASVVKKENRKSKIAFVSQRDGNHEIYTMNPDGTEQRRLTNNNAEDMYPSWSPDGKKIVFESDRDGNYEIYIMNSDGSEQADLTNNKDWDWMPSWSPFLNNPID